MLQRCVNRFFPSACCLAMTALVAAPRSLAGAGEPTLKASVNAGFEQWAVEGPAGWTLNPHPGLFGSWESSSTARTGQRALLLRPGKKGQAHAYQRFFAVGPDMILRATAWVKGQGRAGLQLYTYDAKQVFNGSATGLEFPVDDQFREVSFCYVPDRRDVSFVAIVLSVSGEGSHAIFDDAAVESLPVEELKRTTGYASDLAAEIGAGKWQTSAGTLAVSEGPYAVPAVTLRPVPVDAPRPAFDPISWWRQSGGGGAPKISFAVASGPKFAMRGGVPYEVKFCDRVEQGVGVHYKLHYLDAQSRDVKIGDGPWAYHQIGPTRSGTSPWYERTAMVRPPSGARAAQVEIWVQAGSGPVSVADVSVRVAPASSTSTGGALAVETRDNLLRDARPAPKSRSTDRPAVTVEVSSPGRTTVVRSSKTALEVRLSTGVTLRGAFAGENFLGIGEVRLGSLVLHAADAPPWAPLLSGDPAADYERCELVAAEPLCPNRQDGVTLRLRLAAADGSTDEVRWWLWPHRVRMADLDAVGFGYAFQAEAAGRTLRGVTDRTVWGLAGSAVGLTVFTHQTYSASNRFTPGQSGGSAGGGGKRFVHADPLDFQTGPEGSLVTYFDRPGFVDETTAGVPWGVRVWDEFHLPWGKTVRTGPKYVVFTPARGEDAWSAARDYVVGICRRAYGIRAEAPMPLVNVSTRQYDVGPESKTELRRIADQDVPEFRRLGFKRIYLGPVWEGIVCGPDRIAVAERHGGEAALKHLCDAAHRADMQVIAWLAPGHLWCDSSVFKAHPDWELRGRDGKPPTPYCWPTLRGVDLTTPYADSFVESVRGLRERTGLDGLWLDSYASFTHFIQTADPQFPLRQGESLWRIHGRLHQLGLVTYVEGNACYGVKSVNFPWNGDPQQPVFADPVTLADCSPYTGPGSGPGTEIKAAYLGQHDHYYRLLANKCCVFVFHDAFRSMPGALDRIGQGNRDYNAVVGSMQRRVLLSDDRGVQWNCENVPKVLFAFRPFEYCLPGLESALDVTTGRRLDALGGVLHAEKQHTYLITATARRPK
jgi:hypothetical protein